MRRRRWRRGLGAKPDVHQFLAEEAARKASHYAEKAVEKLGQGRSCRRALRDVGSAERQIGAMNAHLAEVNRSLGMPRQTLKLVERANGDVAEANFVFDRECFGRRH